MTRSLAGQPVIAFDTEFMWERSYSPTLALIQVADRSQAWAIDPLRLSARSMRPLLDILVSPDTLKVAHAVDQDQICLHRTYGIVAEPVLDTAAAAALLGMGEQLGLSTLLRKLLGVRIKKGYTRTNWVKRPIPVHMLKYALEDVAFLSAAADVLRKRLRSLGRTDWALELSARAALQAKAQFDPDAVSRKLADSRRLDKATFGVLRELVAWREERAQKSDVPRKWIAEDKVLVRLASARPTRAEALADFRGVGAIKNEAGLKSLLFAIRQGIRANADDYRVADRKPHVTQVESAALVVLRCFLGVLAASNDLPLRLVVEPDRMVELLRRPIPDVGALQEAKILDERAVDVIGDDVVAILNGGRALRLRGGQAVLEEE